MSREKTCGIFLLPFAGKLLFTVKCILKYERKNEKMLTFFYQ